MVGVYSTAELDVEAAVATEVTKLVGIGLFKNDLLSKEKRLKDLKSPIKKVTISFGLLLFFMIFPHPNHHSRPYLLFNFCSGELKRE